jgi:Uma2 family endonuclease
MLAQSDHRLELIAGVVVDQAGGTIAHARLADGVYRLLHEAATPPCTAYSSIMSVSIAALETHVFPDASYSCESTSPRATTLVAPSLVVEVVSPESVRRDRVDKVDAYKSVPSIVEYLVIDSRRPWICLYRRNADDTWTESVHEAGSSVSLRALDCTIDVDALYRDVL